jgi:2-polyprenyl-3-methyl-5-hydroxy-6-metoxy-1,4-benzoquinol methylase
LDSQEIRERRDRIISEHGPWTAHNIPLADGLYTFEDGRPDFDASLRGYANSLRRLLQIASDLTHKPVGHLRVLDLACLEGIYAIEFARRGAEAVGVEIRESHLIKADFAKEALGVDSVSFVRDDVRNLSRAKYGAFDLVLCLGILYHLNAADACRFVERMSEVCEGVAVIETHFGFNPQASFSYEGREYFGWVYGEHAEGASAEQKSRAGWASADNATSFWFTKPSLYNLIANAGFTSAYDCQLPALPGLQADRETVVAVKGRAVEGEPARWPEEFRSGAVQSAFRSNGSTGLLRRVAARLRR